MSGTILPQTLTNLETFLKLAARCFFKNLPEFGKNEFKSNKVEMCNFSI